MGRLLVLGAPGDRALPKHCSLICGKAYRASIRYWDSAAVML